MPATKKYKAIRNADTRNPRDYVKVIEIPKSELDKVELSGIRHITQQTRTQEDSDTEEKETRRARLVILRLNFIERLCKEHFANRPLLNAHLLKVHHMHQYRCILPNCGASFRLT